MIDVDFFVGSFQDAHSATLTYTEAVRLWASRYQDLAELKKQDGEAYATLYAWCKDDLKTKALEPC